MGAARDLRLMAERAPTVTPSTSASDGASAGRELRSTAVTDTVDL
jgi:hypothetical protein